ncbi:MAG: FHA domain-containing protein [Herbiconiux sp.]|nr:FHA domain-containing protein [Herbiconiux sp.]
MVHFDIDLRFSSTEAADAAQAEAAADSATPSRSGSAPGPGSGEGGGARATGGADAADSHALAGFHGRITASGSTVHVFVSDPDQLPRRRSNTLRDLRVVAAALARRGVELSIESPAGTLVRLGAVKPNALQRVVTWSPHILLGSPAALAPLLGRGKGAATKRVPLPPATLFPLAPTVMRGIRRRATTTHARPGEGRPRLIFVVGSENWDGRPPREFDLLPGVTTIGSGPDADLRLPGLEPLHAEIRHDENDEYVLHALAPTGGGAAVPDAGPERVAGGATRRAAGRVLRTGARMDLGQWRLAYFREEFADHGRPFGGRLGGELARQKPQPPRSAVPGSAAPGGAAKGGAAGGSGPGASETNTAATDTAAPGGAATE